MMASSSPLAQEGHLQIEMASEAIADAMGNHDVDENPQSEEKANANETQCDKDEESLDADFDWMTQSQFAQVIFHDIADSYPNDSDLLCKFTLTDLVEPEVGDRIGIYRVPNIAAHECKAFAWVEDAEVNAKDKKELQILFKGADLPKKEDFFQFLYARSNHTIVGASVPFQLRKPKSEELCTVEDEEDFMVVKSNTALVQEQYKSRVAEMEQNCSKLQSLCEKLQDELDEKSQSFIMLDQECKSLRYLKTTNEELGKDLALTLKDRTSLEKQLQKALDDLEKMTTKTESLMTDQDKTRGQIHQLELENKLYKDESKQLTKKLEELNKTLVATTKNKEEAVKEIRKHILRRDELLKELTKVKTELGESNFELKESEKRHKKHLAEKDAEISNLKDMIRDIMNDQDKQKLTSSTKDSELESKFQIENESLKDTIGNLMIKIACLEGRLRDLHESRAFEEEEERNSRKADSARIEHMEKIIQSLEKDLRTHSMSYSKEINDLRDELESLRVNSLISSNLSSANRNMDSLRIMEALDSCDATQATNDDTNVISAQPKSNLTANEDIAKPLDLSSKTPQSSCSESDINPDMVDCFTLPDEAFFGQSATNNSKRKQQQKDDSQTKPIPLTSIFTFSSLWNQTNSDDQERDQFKDLAAWASSEDKARNHPQENEDDSRGSREPSSEASGHSMSSSFILTDDGRPIPIEQQNEESNLLCPICNAEFEASKMSELQFHVDNHLATTSTCPVCSVEFDRSDGEAFEEHVQDHFTNNEVSFMSNVFQQQEGRNRNEEESDTSRSPRSNLGEIVGSISQSLRSWALDID